jgi:hypothetical protein
LPEPIGGERMVTKKSNPCAVRFAKKRMSALAGQAFDTGMSVRPSKTNAHSDRLGEQLPKALPRIAFHHGETLRALSRLGFEGKASRSAFYEYVKSLRKLGMPFERAKLGLGRGLANYSYCHLMELTLALTLRVYHVVPDALLVEIIRYRRTLYPL